MFFKIVIIGISFVVILIAVNMILPKVKQKYRLHKKVRENKKRQELFMKKMKELEIN